MLLGFTFPILAALTVVQKTKRAVLTIAEQGRGFPRLGVNHLPNRAK